jgi:hypothetical protein
MKVNIQAHLYFIMKKGERDLREVNGSQRVNKLYSEDAIPNSGLVQMGP